MIDGSYGASLNEGDEQEAANMSELLRNMEDSRNVGLEFYMNHRASYGRLTQNPLHTRTQCISSSHSRYPGS